ncbi:hypothetical protein L3X38_039118 [Prunus dulcis]|uniref:Uncharacterized protein n=1 Tax=Prunus dulcis TaxID=3755 RepID=A0AAD4V6E1_PRUDU|nr:hypothetical protein L3X38_039118 [Prunus dulcis]
MLEIDHSALPLSSLFCLFSSCEVADCLSMKCAANELRFFPLVFVHIRISTLALLPEALHGCFLSLPI